MKVVILTTAAFLMGGGTQAFAPSTSIHHSLAGRPTIHFITKTCLDMARKPFISGNWKLNPQSREEAVKLASDIAASITPSSPLSDVALFVPYVFIEAARDAVQGKLEVGAEVRFCCDVFY
jgi:Triosephosphate isomerase